MNRCTITVCFCHYTIGYMEHVRVSDDALAVIERISRLFAQKYSGFPMPEEDRPGITVEPGQRTYMVTVTKRVLVVAPNKAAAKTMAMENAGDDLSPFDVAAIEQYESLAEIPAEWQDATPWVANPDDDTGEEIPYYLPATVIQGDPAASRDGENRFTVTIHCAGEEKHSISGVPLTRFAESVLQQVARGIEGTGGSYVALTITRDAA